MLGAISKIHSARFTTVSTPSTVKEVVHNVEDWSWHSTVWCGVVWDMATALASCRLEQVKVGEIIMITSHRNASTTVSLIWSSHSFGALPSGLLFSLCC